MTIFEPNPEDSTTVVTLYSIANGESVEISLPFPLVGEVVEGLYPSWLPDGRMRLALRLDRVLGVGETWEVFTIDAETGSFEKETLELNLPDYEYSEYDSDRGIPTGFVSVDPTYQRVLYTARNGNDHEVRLLSLDSQTYLWRIISASLENTVPQWSRDGESVTLVIGEPISRTSYAWSRIISLSKDGIEKELAPQPFPKAENYIANISQSPDERYIFYSLYSYETRRVHGYVIDTVTWVIGDVCDSSHDLLSSLPFDKVEVDWLPGGQLVYRVLIQGDGKPMHSLRILDIPSWTSQVIYETESGYGINVFGWTPMEYGQK